MGDSDLGWIEEVAQEGDGLHVRFVLCPPYTTRRLFRLLRRITRFWQ